MVYPASRDVDSNWVSFGMSIRSMLCASENLSFSHLSACQNPGGHESQIYQTKVYDDYGGESTVSIEILFVDLFGTVRSCSNNISKG
jgi:hypothetical protein